MGSKNKTITEISEIPTNFWRYEYKQYEMKIVYVFHLKLRYIQKLHKLPVGQYLYSYFKLMLHSDVSLMLPNLSCKPHEVTQCYTIKNLIIRNVSDPHSN